MTVTEEIQDRMEFDSIRRYPGLSMLRVPEPDSRDRHRSGEAKPGRRGDGSAVVDELLPGGCDLVSPER
jgi:hypothetical protein